MPALGIKIQSAVVDADLTDFPLVITERDIPASFFDTATAANIQVKSSGGGTDLLTEVAWCDTVNDRLRVHVKVPSILAAVDTIVELHWDVTPTNTGSVFTFYKHVLPLKVLQFVDVVDYGTDAGTGTLTESGSGTWTNDGYTLVGNSSDYLDYSGVTAMPDFYVVYAGELADTVQRNAVSLYASSVNRHNMTIDDGTQVAQWDNGNSWLDTSPVVNPPKNTLFTHQMWFDEGIDRAVWYNGGNKGYDGTVGNISDRTGIKIGQSHPGSEYWSGLIQEVRVATTEPSAEWITFEYRNLINTDDYAVVELGKRRVTTACRI